MSLPDIPLFSLIVHAPMVAVSKRWPTVAHAATWEAILATHKSGRLIVAPCGRKGLRIVVGRDGEGRDYTIAWPIAARVPDGLSRCRECWVATGKKRPRKGTTV